MKWVNEFFFLQMQGGVGWFLPNWEDKKTNKIEILLSQQIKTCHVTHRWEDEAYATKKNFIQIF